MDRARARLGVVFVCHPVKINAAKRTLRVRERGELSCVYTLRDSTIESVVDSLSIMFSCEAQYAGYRVMLSLRALRMPMLMW